MESVTAASQLDLLNRIAELEVENARLMSELAEMKKLLEARKVIERAKGILQDRHGMTEEQAYLDLRGESRRLRRPMKELAEAIILADELHRKAWGDRPAGKNTTFLKMPDGGSDANKGDRKDV